jgi:hypothetical protein
MDIDPLTKAPSKAGRGTFSPLLSSWEKRLRGKKKLLHARSLFTTFASLAVVRIP